MKRLRHPLVAVAAVVALALLGRFLAQFYPPFQQYEGLLLFSEIYVVLGLAVLVARRRYLPEVIASVRRYGFGGDDEPVTGDRGGGEPVMGD